MTLRLGLRLTLRGGREAGIRLGLIAAAVAIGVAVLLSVLADLHAFDATGSRPCWECTQGSPLAGSAPIAAPNAELWNYSEDYYQGRPIERLDVATLGPDAPVMPGLTRMPGAGQYDVSPALATLLGSAPSDQLGARFPGTRAGEIGPAALSSPDELVIVVGYTPARLAALPATAEVTALATRPQINSTSTMYRYGFGIATIGLLFPVLTLIGTATRLAAARREERFAAFRLVGATSRQINAIASVEAITGALFGTLAGMGVFLLARPGVAHIAITGSRYYEALVTPTVRGYVAVLVGVPVGAVCAALWSLRRVRISPLGATRRTTPAPPGWWRTLPLLAGLLCVVVPVVIGGAHRNSALVDIGLLLVMIGLMVGGSWLTMRAARLLPRLARGASALLAARRLADNPKAAFRSVSGLVLAVFVGTTLAGVVPAIIKGQQVVASGALTNVLRASFTSGEMPSCVGTCDAVPTGPATNVADGLAPATGTELISRLRSEPGTTVLPLYAAPEASGAASSSASGPQAAQGVVCGPDACVPEHREIVSCATLRSFPSFGQCAPGATAVSADFSNVLLVDNMLAIKDDLPVIGRDSLPVSTDLSTLKLAAVMVDITDPATLERVRTLLAAYTARAGATNAPQTFGEIAQARAFIYNQIDEVSLVMVALTLLVAGCSLVVAVGGGVVERKRPFTLLRLSGTPAPTLYAVVLFESLLPLVAAAVVAAGVGLAVSEAVVSQLKMTGVSHIGLPGHTYFLTTGGGLVASFAVILAALPLLRRVTQPENARFE